MIDRLRVDELVEGRRVLVVEHFLEEPVNPGLVLFGGHPRNSFQDDTHVTLLC